MTEAHLDYIIVGDGELRPDLEALIRSCGLEGRIHLAGFRSRSETLKIMGASDFFLMSSSTEGTPMVLLEAAALSVPIIATKVGGIPDLFTDGVHARIISFGDERQLSKTILEFYQDPSTAKALAKNAYTHILKTHDLNLQITSTLMNYKIARQVGN